MLLTIHLTAALLRTKNKTQRFLAQLSDCCASWCPWCRCGGGKANDFFYNFLLLEPLIASQTIFRTTQSVLRDCTAAVNSQLSLKSGAIHRCSSHGWERKNTFLPASVRLQFCLMLRLTKEQVQKVWILWSPLLSSKLIQYLETACKLLIGIRQKNTQHWKEPGEDRVP